MQFNHSHLILDACCVLNFSASGRFVEIIESLPAQVVVTQVVKDRELVSLRRLADEGHEDSRQFHDAINQDLLLVEDFTEPEEETFVNYAFELGDDGESATCAIAVHREWAVATDDRKAISFFGGRRPSCKSYQPWTLLSIGLRFRLFHLPSCGLCS